VQGIRPDVERGKVWPVHPPEKLAEMLAVLEARGADLVLGNRYMPGGGTVGWSLPRRVLSRLGCAGSKLILGLPFDDLSVFRERVAGESKMTAAISREGIRVTLALARAHRRERPPRAGAMAL